MMTGIRRDPDSVQSLVQETDVQTITRQTGVFGISMPQVLTEYREETCQHAVVGVRGWGGD